MISGPRDTGPTHLYVESYVTDFFGPDPEEKSPGISIPRYGNDDQSSSENENEYLYKLIVVFLLTLLIWKYAPSV